MSEAATSLMYQRGYRHGLEGLSPSSTSADYWRGFNAGRQERFRCQYHGYFNAPVTQLVE